MNVVLPLDHSQGRVHYVVRRPLEIFGLKSRQVPSNFFGKQVLSRLALVVGLIPDLELGLAAATNIALDFVEALLVLLVD